MKEIDKRDNFPMEFYEELARLTVAFGRVEYMIKLCIKSLRGKGFTAGMAHAESKRQFKTLCDEAKNQANAELSAAQARAFCDLINRAKDLGDYRNDSIHALWTTDESSGEPLRVRPKWDKKSKSVDWSLSGPVAVTDLQDKRKEMEKLFSDLVTERRAWP